MSKLGDMPVPLVLTRDQVRTIRGALSVISEFSPEWSIGPVDIQPVLDLLDSAETQATIVHASKKPENVPHWRCGTVHGPSGCPRGGGNDGWHISDGEWESH